MSIQPEFGIIPGWDKADRLRKARELTGLNQSAFAREIDVAPNTVSNAERGTVDIRKVTLRAWSLRTGVNFQWLETGEAPSSPDGDDGASRNGSEEPGRSSEPWAPRDLNPQPAD